MLITEAHLNLLRAADSPTVANVIELFGIRSQVAGYANGSIKAVYPELPPAVGYAVTATFRTGYPGDKGESYGDMPALIEAGLALPEPRIVVFQDLDDPPRAATYGEVMATSFQKFGFAGLITSGAARDIEQVRALNFPCWAASTIVSHGYPRIVDIGIPVTVGGLQIKPGDLLHADANGIIEIPHNIAPAVAELCAPFMDAEREVLGYLQTGTPTMEGYRAAVGRMKAAVGKLKERASEYGSAP